MLRHRRDLYINPSPPHSSGERIMDDGGGVEEALNEWNPKGVCVIDMGTAMSRTRASDTRGNDTVLPPHPPHPPSL